MNIIDGKYITPNQSQVIELDNCFTLSNQIYEKDTLLPRRFSFLDTPTLTTYNESQWIKTAYIRATNGTQYNRTPTGDNWNINTANQSQKKSMINQSFIIDNVNENALYRFYNSIYETPPMNTGLSTDVPSQLVKYIKNKNKILQDKIVNLSVDAKGAGTGNSGAWAQARDGKYLYDFLYQDDNYIWTKCVFMPYTCGSPGSYSYGVGINQNWVSSSYSRIKCYNKTDLSLKYNLNLGYINTELIGIKDNFLYISCSGDADTYSIRKININTGAIETMITSNLSQKHHIYCTPSELDSDNSIYIARSNTSNTISIERYKFAFNLNDSIAKTIMTITGLPTITLAPWNEGDFISTLTQHTDNTGQQYLNLIIHGYGSNTGKTAVHQIITFMFDSTNANNLIYRNRITFGASYVRGLFSILENKLIVLGGYDYVYFLRWNDTNYRFEYANKYIVPVKNLGVDTNNNVWVQRTDGLVDVLPLNLPTVLDIQFEKDSYHYKKTQIESYVTAICKNHLGDKLSITVRIGLTGNLFFKENGKQIIEKQTDSIIDLKIPIIINGPGLFHADIVSI